MVLVTFAGTKVTWVRANARIKCIHREAIRNETGKQRKAPRRTRRFQNQDRRVATQNYRPSRSNKTKHRAPHRISN
jgi:hypothetical protein